MHTIEQRISSLQGRFIEPQETPVPDPCPLALTRRFASAEYLFDEHFKLDINFANMEFEEISSDSEACSISHVNYCGKPWVLKVFHNGGNSEHALDLIRDLTCFRHKIRAYCSLTWSKI